MCLHKGRDFPARHRDPAGVQKSEEHIATARTNVSREIMKTPSYRKAFHTATIHYLLQIKEIFPVEAMSLPAPLVASPVPQKHWQSLLCFGGQCLCLQPQHSQAGVV